MTPALYIHSLQLENFRGFKEFDLELHPRLNVFLGNNGVGKSSILDALRIAIAVIVDDLDRFSPSRKVMSYNDISNGETHNNVSVMMYDGQEISWTLRAMPTIEKGKKNATTSLISTNLENYVTMLKKFALDFKSTQNLPVFVNYQATRNPSSHVIRDEDDGGDFLAAACYEDAINATTDFNSFFNWFKSKEDFENECKYKYANLKYTDPQLDVVRNAIEQCFEVTSFSFDRKHWMFCLKKKDQEIYYSQLSDGEKGYLLLVADIARRISTANRFSATPLSGKGIIIIDEIELHLHPTWQRQIISQLMNTFSGCQFIISTHSPQVIGEIIPESIWILEEGEAPYHPSRSYGMESSDLLREVMDAPSASTKVTSDLLEIERLMDAEDYDKVREKIVNLAKRAKDIPALIGFNALLTMEGQEQVDLES